MSGETAASESGWTTDTLHSHVLRMLADERRTTELHVAAAEKAVTAALVASDKFNAAALTAAKLAVDKAEAAQRAHDEAANGIQGRMDLQARTFAPLKETDRALDVHSERLRDLELAGRGLVDMASFRAYCDRHDGERSEERQRLDTERNADRRQRLALGMGAAVALMGTLVNVVLTLAR